MLFPDTDLRRVSVALIGGVSRQCYHSISCAHASCEQCIIAMRRVESTNNVVVGIGWAPPWLVRKVNAGVAPSNQRTLEPAELGETCQLVCEQIRLI